MAEHNINIKQGETFKLDAIYKIEGDAVDITGWKARMQIRPTFTSLILIANLDNADLGGIDIPTGTDGKAEIRISAIETANYTFLEGFYDLELEDPGGEVVRLLQGEYKLDPEVTR